MEPLRKVRGMLPYLAAMFLNAFIDLGHKIAIQNTVFKVYDGSSQVVLTAVVNALILLPFILLFSPAGFVSDRFPRHRVMRFFAWGNVVITLLITFSYYRGWFWSAFGLTFLMAVQSAFYSPAKYGYLKPLVGKARLASGNGAVQAVTIVAILSGTFVFSILFEGRFDLFGGASETDILRAIAPLGWGLVAAAVLEALCASRLPALEGGDPSQRFVAADYLRGRALRENLQPLYRRRVIRLSVFGLAVFWSVSQVMLAAFPAFAKARLGVDNTVLLQGILAASGIGIILGSVLAGRWSRDHIESGLIPVGAAGIALGLWLLPSLDSAAAQAFNFFFIGTMGGLFIVPLNALIQFHAGEHELGRVLAGNNLVQNIAMLAFLALTALFAWVGAGTELLLYLIALVALVGTGYTVLKLPQSLARFVLTWFLTRRYRVQVQGFRHLPGRGGVLLLGNHISWIDWAIVQVACPRPVRFVMLRSIYERWYLTWLLRLFGVIPISQGKGAEAALQQVAQLLDEGEVVCLFPEGTISRTGHLATFRAGFERACARLTGDAVIVPFYLRGLWGSQFSRSSAGLRSARKAGLTRDIIVAFGTPLPHTTPADVLKRRVLDLSIHSWQHHVETLPGLAEAWLTTARRMGAAPAIVDAGGVVSGVEALTLALCLARRMRRSDDGNRVGLLLPASSSGALANMAALCAGKTVVNLDYSAGAAAFADALARAGIRTLYSSGDFLRQLEQWGQPLATLLSGVDVVDIDGWRADPGRFELLAQRLAIRLLPVALLRRLFLTRTDPAGPALVLFSSGSEGVPRGVCLSHRNVMANVRQIADVLNMEEGDAVLSSLPLFHAFGLTVTTLMPLLEGLPLVCHPDPADAPGVARAIARHRVTLLCTTPALLEAYARSAEVHPLMLRSLRLAVTGAEKLNEEARSAFKLKFGCEVYEGYGATETTPVIAVNLPDALDTAWWQVQVGNKPGSVGLPLPGSSCKIVDPETLLERPTGEPGLILAGGSQVMLGYLDDPEGTAEVIVELDGLRWFRTGDWGYLDQDGFLTVVDRCSRLLARADGVVSLAAVEAGLRRAIAQPGLALVAVGLPDAEGAERVVALIAGELQAAELQRRILAASLPPALMPNEIHLVTAVPTLGSGKVDHLAARQLAAELMG